MATMVNELYDALKAAGVDEATARRAAQAVRGVDDEDQLATKGDLRTAIAELKSALLVWGVAAIFSAIGIYSAIMVALFRSMGTR